MGFALFILVNAMLFIRPGEAMPWLGELPVYLMAIVACLFVSMPAILEMCKQRRRAVPPILLCVAGLLVAIPVSDMANGKGDEVIEHTVEFFKVLIYLVLLVSLLNSAARIRRFVAWIGVFSAVTALLATVQYHGAIEIAEANASMPETPKAEETTVNKKPKQRGAFVQEKYKDPETGKMVPVQRICGTGLFSDPNDLGLVLITGVPIALYWMARRETGGKRWLWLLPLAVFFYTLILTSSRGSMLALMAGLGVLFLLRHGRRRSVMVGLAVFPVLLIVFAGRMTDFTSSEGTGSGRIQLWSEGLWMFREAPLWGVGMNEFAMRARLVAHNSFIHCYAELGLPGGTLFLGAFVLALLAMIRLSRDPERIADPELRKLHPFLMAFFVAFLVGILFLSRAYVVPTYTVLGLIVAYLRVATAAEPEPVATEPKRWRLTPRPLWTLACASIGFLIAAEAFCRTFHVGK